MWNELPGQPVSASPNHVTLQNVPGWPVANVVSHQSPLSTTMLKAPQVGDPTSAALPHGGVMLIDDPRLCVRERPFRAMVNLRGDARDARFVRTAQTLLGCALPLRPNTTSAGPVYRVIWTGPDEWWVQSHDWQASITAAKLESDLREAFGDQAATATDVGSGYTTLEIDGVLARPVLARGCPLDLHARVFAPDHCAQSHFFKADVVLIRIEGDLFEMIVRRSFATYVTEILHDAAQPLLAD